MAIWNRSRECMARDQMNALQSASLRETVERVYANVPAYREKMQRAGLMPADINGIQDLSKLPFTTKQDLRDNYPYGLFAAPMSDIVRIQASSGTTGKQTVTGYTKKDIMSWAEIMARTITAAGGGKNTILQVAYGYGLFTGGLGAHYGGEMVGASVIPVSGGNSQRQIEIMRDFGSTMLACTPSYALYLSEHLQEAGVKLSEISLKSGIFGAEPWTVNMRDEIQSRFNIKAYDIYGIGEVMGPGVSFECECQDGLHINEDMFLPEIIDPETLEPLPEGETGELVFTTIAKEGLTLVRYRTRDICSLHYGDCACGRTTVKMSKLQGRTDDMLIIRGVNVFPSQIESVLLELGESPHYMIIVDRVNNLDVLEIQVEVSDEQLSGTVRELEAMEKRISMAMQGRLSVSAKIRLVQHKTIARSEGKAKRVIDNRKLK